MSSSVSQGVHTSARYVKFLNVFNMLTDRTQVLPQLDFPSNIKAKHPENVA